MLAAHHHRLASSVAEKLFWRNLNKLKDFKIVMAYILYIKRDCPFCVQAQELLASKEQEYSLIDIQDHPVLVEEIKKPMIGPQCQWCFPIPYVERTLSSDRWVQ